MQGSMSQLRYPHPGAFERAQSMRTVKSVQQVLVAGRESWKLSGD
jgi:hypothetical protein